MKQQQSSASSGAAPAASIVALGTLFSAIVPTTMRPWRLAGFVDGLVCGLGPAPEEAFSDDEDPDGALFIDCIDEISRDAEDTESALLPEDIAAGDSGAKLKTSLVAAVRDAESTLSLNEGMPALAFADAANADPAKADIATARAYAQGLLRGLVMSIEDEDELSDERYGEVLGLLFILTEDDMDADFGTAAEIKEARQSVVAALPGLVSQLWALSHEEE